MVTHNLSRWIAPLLLVACAGAYLVGLRVDHVFRQEIARRLTEIAVEASAFPVDDEISRQVTENGEGVVLTVRYDDSAATDEVLGQYAGSLTKAGWLPLFGRPNAYRNDAACLLLDPTGADFSLQFVWMTDVCRPIYGGIEYRHFADLMLMVVIAICLGLVAYLVPWKMHQNPTEYAKVERRKSLSDEGTATSAEYVRSLSLVLVALLGGGGLLTLLVAVFGMVENMRLLSAFS